MFKAIVLACYIASPTDCVEFTDTRGPLYKSERECEARAMELVRAIGKLLPDLRATRWRCQPVRKGMLINGTD